MIKRTFKIFLKTAIVIIGMLLLVWLIMYITIPISRPNSHVEKYVLSKIELGSSWEEVLEAANRNGWETLYMREDCGLIVKPDSSSAIYFATDSEIKRIQAEKYKDFYYEIVGNKSIWLDLGDYYALLNNSVSAYLAFDEKDGLIAVYIRRDIDGL